MLPEPKSPYALAKLAGEYYLKVYAECYGLETVALRYFNVFGPRQDPSSMYSGVISIFAERIKKGSPITLYGDGQQTRDFVNVTDVVLANLLAMGADLKSKVESQKSHVGGQRSAPCSMPHAPCAHNFVALNVAAGRQTSLLDLVAVLGELCGKAPEVRFAVARDGDIRHSLADISKVRNVLGYESKADLKDGLKRLLA
jgi:UDP-glucose 4-epimerase